MVKRTVPTDRQLLAGGVDAAQEIIVAPDTGANVKVTLRRPAKHERPDTGALRRPG